MNYFIAILAILIIIFLWNNHSKKKKLRKLKKYIISSWGKPKDKEYYNFYSISQYFQNTSHKKNAFQTISDRTANDLDINEIFKFIDRTSSKIGQQYLYFKLRTIQNIKVLKENEKLSIIFLENEKLRISSQLLLSKLNNHNTYDFETLINNKTIEKPSHLKYLYLLSIGSVISIILTTINPVFILLLMPIFIINIIFHYKNKQNINYYISAITQLVKSLNVGEQLATETEIKNHFKDVSFLKKIKRVKLKTQFVSFDNKMDDPITSILWLFVELIKIQFNLDTILFYSFIDSINNEKQNLDKLFQFIGKIDVAITIASIKSGSLNTCKPQFIKEQNIITTDIYHPLIKNCITNSIELNNKSLLLTGSNMSGKTTFIRTLAVNTILAQTLNICFAKDFKLPFLKVYSSIRITDDLLDDTSYYLQEVLTIKELIETSNNKAPCLFVLDEIFKGTNTIERISGGKSILSYLNKNHFVVVSTHDIELTDLLKDEFDLYHFTENIYNNELNFDHKLKQGKLTTRNAIKILELYNYPQEIIINAKKIEKDNF